MKIKTTFTLIALFISLMGIAQNAEEKADAVVQEEMKIYHQELDLTGEQTYQLTQILSDKIKKSQIVAAQIEELKKQLDQIDLSADKQVLSILNEEQRKVMQEKLNSKLAKQQEDFKNALTD